jgi:hypothetical protein
MPITADAARRNGVVPMPIKTVDIDCTPAGYPGWTVSMRLNPRSSVYDDFISSDVERSWRGLAAIVQSWNFSDEQGQPIKQPRDCASASDADLPFDLYAFIVRAYLDAFNAAAAPPKEPENSSATT